MSKIKLRYVAQIVIDAEVDTSGENVLPFEEIKYNAKTLNSTIKELLEEEICSPDQGTVEITEQFLDVYETEEE